MSFSHLKALRQSPHNFSLSFFFASDKKKDFNDNYYLIIFIHLFRQNFRQRSLPGHALHEKGNPSGSTKPKKMKSLRGNFAQPKVWKIITMDDDNKEGNC